ncbi:hypothetical protein GGR52DRAFT_296206 [Hypoxylon sp. FL1284]|nr:hypothetical protein GGR52DRAFT_296206 [Hypoxylon sp. FL1284]
MRSTTFRVALLAATVSLTGAQDTTTTTDDSSSSSSSTGCAAQNIVDACLSTTESYVSLCGTTDYSCLCEKYTAIATCFNNCPDDSRSTNYQQQKNSYCMNASLYSTTLGNRTMHRSMTSNSLSSVEVTTTSDIVVGSSDAVTTDAAPKVTESAKVESGADEHLGRTGALVAAVAGAFAALL